MTLEFDYTFDVYLTAEAISQIQVAIDVFHPNTGDGSGVAREVSLTLTDPL
jgi:hypothetical protein